MSSRTLLCGGSGGLGCDLLFLCVPCYCSYGAGNGRCLVLRCGGPTVLRGTNSSLILPWLFIGGNEALLCCGSINVDVYSASLSWITAALSVLCVLRRDGGGVALRSFVLLFAGDVLRACVCCCPCVAVFG